MRAGIVISTEYGKLNDYINLHKVVQDFSQELPVLTVDNFFDRNCQVEIKKLISEKNLEGIVFAGDSPRYFEELLSGREFISEIEDLGINPNHISHANIKEQVYLVHKNDISGSTKKAVLLIRVAVEKLKLTHDVTILPVQPLKKIMIVGTSPGGIISAFEFAKKGYKVYIIEKNNSINAKSREIPECQSSLAVLEGNSNVTFYMNSNISEFYGWPGLYKVNVTAGENSHNIEVGGVIMANDDNPYWLKELKFKMHLTLDENGHLWNRRSQGNSKLIGRTLDDGIWFIPSFNDGDYSFDQEMASAHIAVNGIDNILRNSEVKQPLLSSEVDKDRCGGCCVCIKTCAFHASSFDSDLKIAKVDNERCKGCGNCVVACPTTARDLTTYPKKYIFSAIDILKEGVSDSSDKKVLLIACRGCGYPALDLAGKKGLTYPVNTLPLEIECGGNIDTQYILEALTGGFDGVALTICKDGDCQHIVGNVDMVRRLGLFREILRSRDINSDRLRIIKIDCNNAEEITSSINEFHQYLKNI